MAEPEPPVGGLPLAGALSRVAEAAGDIALRYFRGQNRTWTKAGNSPVSEADVAVHDYLLESLAAEFPGVAFVSEEDEDALEIPQTGMAIVADPIDGTRGFIEGNENWAIAVALLRDLVPVAAVVHCPAAGRLFSAEAGKGALLNGRRLACPPGPLRRLTGSRKINAELTAKFGDRFETVECIPSLACRLVMVAAGEIDAALARPGAHVWDIAAPSLILAEAGGELVTVSGEPWRIRRRAARAPALIAAGAGRLAAALALAKASSILQ